jgi:hypothetical protein
VLFVNFELTTTLYREEAYSFNALNVYQRRQGAEENAAYCLVA